MTEERVHSLSDLFRLRTSCRDFGEGDVATEDVEALLSLGRGDDESGRAYASAHDLRPVSVSLVPESVDRRELESAVYDDQPWLVRAPIVLAITADLTRSAGDFAEQDSDGLRGRDFAMIEAGMLAQSIALTCADRGLGSVFVGGVRQEELAAVLGTSRHVVGLVAVGWPNRDSRV